MNPSIEWCLLGGRCAHVGAVVLLGKGGEDSVQDRKGKGKLISCTVVVRQRPMWREKESLFFPSRLVLILFSLLVFFESK